jgi:aspartyl-tRNA(Asn)/glutamyl-tRNA(Gln) amidotransferase subunit A
MSHTVPLYELTLTEVLAGVSAKKFSMAEVQAAVQARQTEVGHLNIYLAQPESAPGELPGPLQGAPISFKDNILTPGLATTASSNVLRGYMPHYEATVARKLREAGAWNVGKTNLDAWAHGSSTETSDFGPTKNPRNPEYIPGGSSGGAAASIAANATIAAIGTETAGSIRQPAAWCGAVGLKPTYGRVSRAGIAAMGSSLDCPGPITKTVEDAALLLEIMAGQDKYDGTTSPKPVSRYRDALVTDFNQPLKGLKIGLIYTEVLTEPAIQQAYDEARQTLESLGATVEIAQAMETEYAIGVYAVVQRAEVSSNLSRYDGIRYGHDRSNFGAEAKRRIMLGTYTLSKGYAERFYTKAQQVRTLYINDFARLFETYDILVAPVTPGYALKLGESKKYPFFGEMIDRLVEPCSLAGLPGISVPCFVDLETNLTLGLNIMAPAFEESRLITVAHAYEQATTWNPWVNRMKSQKEQA